MEIPRFYLPDLRAAAAGPRSSRVAATLPPDQGHHARAVLRLAPGQRIILFDGAGSWAEAILAGAAGDRLPEAVTAALAGPVHEEPAPSPRLTLASAVPKGDRAEWLVEQASQLNVTDLRWLACERGVVKPQEGGGKLGKWRRLAIESAKQCGRTHLLQIHALAPLAEVLRDAAGRGEQVLWLEPREDGSSRRIVEALAEMPPETRFLALVGPEGGWSSAEAAVLEGAAQGGPARVGATGFPDRPCVTRVRLTRNILRIETACAAIAAIVATRG